MAFNEPSLGAQLTPTHTHTHTQDKDRQHKTCLEPKDGAAVVDEVKLRVASPPDLLPPLLRLAELVVLVPEFVGGVVDWSVGWFVGVGGWDEGFDSLHNLPVTGAQDTLHTHIHTHIRDTYFSMMGR
jgi:hypothetical protein